MTRRIAISFKRSGERGIGLGKKISDSLSAQLLCGVLAALLASLAAFGIAFGSGNALLDRTVYGQPFARKMADKQFSELQEYATEEQITQETIHRLNVWCRQDRKLDLVLYNGSHLLFASSRAEKVPDTADWTIDDENPESQYVLTLSDGISVTAFLYYYTLR